MSQAEQELQQYGTLLDLVSQIRTTYQSFHTQNPEVLVNLDFLQYDLTQGAKYLKSYIDLTK